MNVGATRPPVLVVDNDESVRQSVCRLLERAGYSVFQASDGATALDLLRTSDRPLVALLDYVMPRLTGYAVLDAAAHDSPRLQRHAYILMTGAHGRTFPLALLHLLDNLSVPIVSKPINTEKLLAAVEAAARRLAADD
jgi:CheY-like chemotaxis protein